jgi:hypothetical protein
MSASLLRPKRRSRAILENRGTHGGLVPASIPILFANLAVKMLKFVEKVA